MQAIVSLLDPPHFQQVEALWRMLKTDCDLSGIQATPLPHFSWQIAEEYDLDKVKQALTEVARTVKRFPVFTTGLGLFTGDRPVLYIPIVKDEYLENFHREVWSRTLDIGTKISLYYAPHAWMPHITLAHGDVDRGKLICAIEKLSFQTFNWEIMVENLALVHQQDDLTGDVLFQIPFQG
jgi:2'-5' RNA ligase